ncbi:methyltransferase [Streptomyces sp. SL13]|jgi:hypothetical protein|uniref:Methyltransferase n=1 Tax=Streptantibioticus silvisoli TaxID=2705255 RepID=A0AA90K9E3_9ACTN|nr:methyltransferase [Streptantibioticus silvisoli]MDI5966984.1 methyltransferase [Streptantibioticus silvisoli]MDI5971053.1 methyltransferase [Streptantibioticus silvisoli]
MSQAPPPPAPADRQQRPGVADRAALFAVLTGGWIAQAVYAVTRLGVPDLLAEGPRTVEELAASAGADTRTLYRTLRVLAAQGLLHEPQPRTFELTSVTRLLCADTSRSAQPTALMFGEEVHRSFGEIAHTLRTGRPAFDRLAGTPFYDYLGEHPQAAATFHAAMGAAAVPAALARCDLTGVGSFVDVGGGEGGLLARVLGRHRSARGVLVDLPESIGQARERLAAAGVADRVEFVAGSFFDAGVLPAGADVYALSRVLHNWDDEGAAAILARVRQAVPPHGRLLVFEYLEDTAPARGGDPLDTQAKLIDLLMMVMLDGHDRSREEYTALLEAAGFAVRSVDASRVRASRTESVIEAVPV